MVTCGDFMMPPSTSFFSTADWASSIVSPSRCTLPSSGKYASPALLTRTRCVRSGTPYTLTSSRSPLLTCKPRGAVIGWFAGFCGGPATLGDCVVAPGTCGATAGTGAMVGGDLPVLVAALAAGFD